MGDGDIDGDVVIYEHSVPEIDLDVLQNGAVIAYIDAGGYEYEALPSTSCDDFDNDLYVDECTEVTYLYSQGKLSIGLISTYSDIVWNEDFSVSIKAAIVGGP